MMLIFTISTSSGKNPDYVDIIPDDMLCDIFYKRIHVEVWNRLYKRTLLGLRRVYTYNVDNETLAIKMLNIDKQELGALEIMDFTKVNLKSGNERLHKAVELSVFYNSLIYPGTCSMSK